MKTLKVLFVHAPTVGFRKDVAVLGDALHRVVGDVELYSLVIPHAPAFEYEKPLKVPAGLESRAPFDIAFLFEHLYGHAPLRSADFARRRAFIPNVEWLMPQDEIESRSHPPDIVLYKNHFAGVRCEATRSFSGAPIRIVTGWTTPDFHPTGGLRPKDFRSFLHVRGFSIQKRTELLLSVWRSNPDFPPLTLISSPAIRFQTATDMRSTHNVDVIVRELSEAELRHRQQAHGIHVYPSCAEGFGHALNEARICGSVLVTTGAPPMDELVTQDASGFLIPVAPADISPLRRGMKFEVRAAALASTIRQVLATPASRLAEFGQHARTRYVGDFLRFHSRIRNMLSAAGIHSNPGLTGQQRYEPA